MNKFSFKSFLYVFGTLLVFLFPQTVSAHDGGEARIEISAERLNPGSVLQIRGVDFEYDEEVELILVGPQDKIPLGTAIADAEGIFLSTINLPADLGEGVYVIRAILADDHVVESPQIMVFGMPDFSNSEDDQLAQEDSLLAPMPTLATGAPTPVMSSVLPTQHSVDTESSMIPSGLIAVGVGIAVLLVFILILKRR